MKQNKWVIVGGISVLLAILILGSIASPLMIYLVMVTLGCLVVFNMIRIDRLEPAGKEAEEETPIKEIPLEETKKEPGEVLIPEDEKKRIDLEIGDSMQMNVEQGHDLKTIVEAFVKKGYSEEYIVNIGVQVGLIEVKEEAPPIETKIDLGEKKEEPKEVKTPKPVEVVEQKETKETVDDLIGGTPGETKEQKKLKKKKGKKKK